VFTGILCCRWVAPALLRAGKVTVRQGEECSSLDVAQLIQARKDEPWHRVTRAREAPGQRSILWLGAGRWGQSMSGRGAFTPGFDLKVHSPHPGSYFKRMFSVSNFANSETDFFSKGDATTICRYKF